MKEIEENKTPEKINVKFRKFLSNVVNVGGINGKR